MINVNRDATNLNYTLLFLTGAAAVTDLKFGSMRDMKFKVSM